jgi:hypothetical protein
MDLGIAGKVVLVAGGSRPSISKPFAAEGGKVVLSLTDTITYKFGT